MLVQLKVFAHSGFENIIYFEALSVDIIKKQAKISTNARLGIPNLALGNTVTSDGVTSSICRIHLEFLDKKIDLISVEIMEI